MKEQNIVENRELNLGEALIPVVLLMALLAYNIFAADGVMFGDYSNQLILLIGAAVAAVVGLFNKTTLDTMFQEVLENIKSVLIPIAILLLVGALAGTWLVSGVIPAMVYYGLKVLHPSVFLPASVVIAAIISIATGSSWTTSATVGIALVGIGAALGIPAGMIAGAVISGAYFGDKMSPLSDTTNLAPAMAGTGLFNHIRYMAFTTVPSILVAIVAFTVLSFTQKASGNADVTDLLSIIDETFTITPWLFVVPLGVILLVLLKAKPLVALAGGVLLAALFAFLFQPDVLQKLSDSNPKSVINAVLTGADIEIDREATYLSNFSEAEVTMLAELQDEGAIGDTSTDEELGQLFPSVTSATELSSKVESVRGLMLVQKLKDLFSAGGMKGMLWTIYLILSAMVFGGVMDGIGALSRITKELLSVAKSTFGLFASTVASCLGLNVIASDQYLALVIPGKMFKEAYAERGLAPENLSRTLEDSGTVTSVLVPWNTCGAYQSGVLGVEVGQYFFYAIFNWISPFMTLLFAGLNFKIRKLAQSEA